MSKTEQQKAADLREGLLRVDDLAKQLERDADRLAQAVAEAEAARRAEAKRPGEGGG